MKSWFHFLPVTFPPLSEILQKSHHQSRNAAHSKPTNTQHQLAASIVCSFWHEVNYQNHKCCTTRVPLELKWPSQCAVNKLDIHKYLSYLLEYKRGGGKPQTWLGEHTLLVSNKVLYVILMKHIQVITINFILTVFTMYCTMINFTWFSKRLASLFLTYFACISPSHASNILTQAKILVVLERISEFDPQWSSLFKIGSLT